MKHARSDYNRRIVDLENKIPEEEPVFLLRGQDELAPRLLLMWASELRLRGGDPVMARSAEDHAQNMINWQKSHKVKTPDMYRDSDEKIFILDKIKEILNSDKIDIKSLIEWVGRYYDSSGSEEVLILLPVDLKQDVNAADDNLTLDSFSLDDETKLKSYKAKVILFCKTANTTKIIKNEFKVN